MPASRNPLVSVVIITHNQAWCIEEVLHSVLRQTYRPIEIIVVDDCSTDATPAKIAAFGDAVISIRQTKNLGKRSPAPVRNASIARAQGDLIALLDGDDVWEPEKLAVQVEAARRYPDSGLIAADGVRFHHEEGTILNETLFVDVPLRQGAEVTARLYEQFLRICLIETPSQIMVPRHIFRTIGLFHDIAADDYDFYLRVAARYDVTLIRQRLVRWRYRPTNRSGPLEGQQLRWRANAVEVRKKHLLQADPAYHSTVNSINRWELCQIAHAAFEKGRRSNPMWTTRYLLKLWRRHPREMPYVPTLLMRLWCPRWVIRFADSWRQA